MAASSSASQIPRFSTPTVLVNAGDRFLILRPHGEGPATEQDGSGGVPVYVAVKVRGRYAEVNDANGLLVCLKCLYTAGGQENSSQVNGLLKSQMNYERIMSAAHIGVSFPGLPSGLGFEYRDAIQDCEFSCIDFPYVDSSIYGFMKNHYFAHGLPEDFIVYIMGKALEVLSLVHGRYTHGKVCAAHILQWKGDFRLSYGASVVDLSSDSNDETKWPYAPVTSVWRWARAPELREASLVQTSHEGDIWMVGIVGLEMAYSGFRFHKEDVNVFNDKVDAIIRDQKLPAILHDSSTTHSSSIFKSKPKSGYGQANPKEQPSERKFSREFETFIFKCLCASPHNRESAARLCNDKYLSKCVSEVKDKHPTLFATAKATGTVADSTFQPN